MTTLTKVHDRAYGEFYVDALDKIYDAVPACSAAKALGYSGTRSGRMQTLPAPSSNTTVDETTGEIAQCSG